MSSKEAVNSKLLLQEILNFILSYAMTTSKIDLNHAIILYMYAVRKLGD